MISAEARPILNTLLIEQRPAINAISVYIGVSLPRGKHDSKTSHQACTLDFG